MLAIQFSPIMKQTRAFSLYPNLIRWRNGYFRPQEHSSTFLKQTNINSTAKQVPASMLLVEATPFIFKR
ncbi:hypothetical protein HYALB_00011497 [Hymenoscyphus albidus]|uniref:Uncharacterized protein n=1 Tax=Hymenoscyphus albidus TaxID=595503 RepID=A0A9N9Q993_9HELO|nr:hypothetical protein HYALB_00011497 [Hymenoscyphus albidus]